VTITVAFCGVDKLTGGEVIATKAYPSKRILTGWKFQDQFSFDKENNVYNIDFNKTSKYEPANVSVPFMTFPTTTEVRTFT